MLESTLFTKKSDNYDLNAHKFEIHNEVQNHTIENFKHKLKTFYS